MLRAFLGEGPFNRNALVFHSRNGSALRETNALHDGLHPVLKALGFRRPEHMPFVTVLNRRWELAGMNPAVLRQQMGHSSAAMTAGYTGEILSSKSGPHFPYRMAGGIVVLENIEKM